MAELAGATKTKSPFMTDTGEMDYDAINARVQQVAGAVRNPILPAVPSKEKTIQMLGGSERPYVGVGYVGREGLSEFGEATALAARENLLAQSKQLKLQAEQQATGVELEGAATIESMRKMDQLMAATKTGFQKSAEAFDVAAAKAEQAVVQANQRMAGTMARLDMAIEKVGGGLDKAEGQAIRSHSIAAASESEETRRQVAAMYGKDSPEYTQFAQSVVRSMHSAIAGIQSTWANFRATLGSNLELARAERSTAEGTQVGLAEKLGVETSLTRASAIADWASREGEFALQVEAFKASKLDALVTGLTGATIARLDTLPFMEYLRQIADEESQAAIARAQSQSGLGGGSGGIGITSTSQMGPGALQTGSSAKVATAKA